MPDRTGYSNMPSEHHGIPIWTYTILVTATRVDHGFDCLNSARLSDHTFMEWSWYIINSSMPDRTGYSNMPSEHHGIPIWTYTILVTATRVDHGFDCLNSARLSDHTFMEWSWYIINSSMPDRTGYSPLSSDHYLVLKWSNATWLTVPRVDRSNTPPTMWPQILCKPHLIWSIQACRIVLAIRHYRPTTIWSSNGQMR